MTEEPTAQWHYSSQMCQHASCCQHMSKTKVPCILHTLNYLTHNTLQFYLASRYYKGKLIKKKVHHCEVWGSHSYANKDSSLLG